MSATKSERETTTKLAQGVRKTRAHQGVDGRRSMNIFALACDPKEAAEMHCDQHVCKMIIETAQILYTYLNSIGELLRLVLTTVHGDVLDPYKPTHANHPCVLWLHGGRSHFDWLVELGLCLCDRYEQIYNKVHKTWEHLFALRTWVYPERLPDDCLADEWLSRLEARGVNPKVRSACAAKVCLTNPPNGCNFGVACMSDDTVPLECDADGDFNLVATYRNLYAHKNAVMFRMKWRKICKPPHKLRRHMV